MRPALSTLRLALAGLLLAFSSAALAAVNLNTADEAELETLPGIGPSKAAAILQYRADHGPFKTVDDLDNVAGIGPSTMASIRDLVTVSGGGSAPPATTSTTPPPSSTATNTAPPTSTGGGCPVNINAADPSGLQSLPGIGPSKADAIFQYRAQNGPYASCDGLDNVAGIGPATLAGLKDCCTVK